jgi:hypothetical protein
MEEVKDEVAEAQALLQQKEKENAQAFQREYQELSKKYGYGFSPVVEITANGVQSGLTLIKL